MKDNGINFYILFIISIIFGGLLIVTSLLNVSPIIHSVLGYSFGCVIMFIYYKLYFTKDD